MRRWRVRARFRARARVLARPGARVLPPSPLGFVGVAGRSGTSTAAGACGSSRAASIWAAGVSTTDALAASIPAAAGSGAAAISRSGTDGAVGTGPLPRPGSTTPLDAAPTEPNRPTDADREPGSRGYLPPGRLPDGRRVPARREGHGGCAGLRALAAEVANGDADVPPHDHPAAGAAAAPRRLGLGDGSLGLGLLRRASRGSGQSFGRSASVSIGRIRPSACTAAVGAGRGAPYGTDASSCRRRRPRSHRLSPHRSRRAAPRDVDRSALRSTRSGPPGRSRRSARARSRRLEISWASDHVGRRVRGEPRENPPIRGTKNPPSNPIQAAKISASPRPPSSGSRRRTTSRTIAGTRNRFSPGRKFSMKAIIPFAAG